MVVGIGRRAGIVLAAVALPVLVAVDCIKTSFVVVFQSELARGYLGCHSSPSEGYSISDSPLMAVTVTFPTA